MYENLCQPWPHVWCGSIDGVNPAVTGFAVESASEILWSATGRRFGNCAQTIRPCRRECPEFPRDTRVFTDGILSSTWGWPYPALLGGEWVNLACGTCGGDCSCGRYSEVLLPEKVNDVLRVEVDGVQLTKNVDWILYDHQRLVRVGEEWPRCQDWSVTGGPGTWIIEASFGEDVPKLGELAVGVLGLEIAKLCCGMDCGLPPEVTRVTRQGVSMEKASITELFQRRSTGLYLPDKFITTYNPHLLDDRARAFNPDTFTPRTQQ